MNYYEILGIPKTATDDDIKQAFRKAASLHHPDKHQGETAKAEAEIKFKEAKEASDVLSDPKKRQMYDRTGQTGQSGPGYSGNWNGGPNPEDIMNAFRAAHEHHMRNATPLVTLQVKIARAFVGEKIPLNVFGSTIQYDLQPGLPPGVSFVNEITLPNGDKRRVQFQILIDAGEYRFKQLGSEDGFSFSGDLEKVITVDALDVMLGAWIKVTDFTGAELQVRVPQGFDLTNRLKVAGRGYSNWRGDGPAERGDLYLQLNPKFDSIDKLDKTKIAELYALTHPKV